MDRSAEVIGAFSEADAARLGAVSVRQLRKWNRIGLLRPAFGGGETHVPYGRVYSFRDLVSVRVLGQLRNVHKVPEQHLIEVQRELAALSDEPWASRTLEVLRRRVVVKDDAERHKREVVGGQRVFDIPLSIEIGNLRDALARRNARSDGQVGKVEKHRFVAENRSVIAGTRIPVDTVLSFVDAGYDQESILREYPELRPADIQAVIRQRDRAFAA